MNFECGDDDRGTDRQGYVFRGCKNQKKSSIIAIIYFDISILYVCTVLIIVIYYTDSDRGVSFEPDKRTRKTGLKKHPY